MQANASGSMVIFILNIPLFNKGIIEANVTKQIRAEALSTRKASEGALLLYLKKRLLTYTHQQQYMYNKEVLSKMSYTAADHWLYMYIGTCI